MKESATSSVNFICEVELDWRVWQIGGPGRWSVRKKEERRRIEKEWTTGTLRRTECRTGHVATSDSSARSLNACRGDAEVDLGMRTSRCVPSSKTKGR